MNEIDTTLPRFRAACAFCGEPAVPPLYDVEEFERQGEDAPAYCSVRCCENAIEARGMAAAAAALR